MLALLGAAIRPHLLTALKWLAVAAAVGAVLLGVRASGRQAEHIKNLERAVQAARRRKDVDTDVARLGDGDALAELRRDWSRSD